jgi:hypothetical protein
MVQLPDVTGHRRTPATNKVVTPDLIRGPWVMPHAVVNMDPRVKPEGDKPVCGKRSAMKDRIISRRLEVSHSVVILGLDPRIHRRPASLRRSLALRRRPTFVGRREGALPRLTFKKISPSPLAGEGWGEGDNRTGVNVTESRAI